MSDQYSAPKWKWSVWDWWVLRKNCRQRDVVVWSSHGVGTSSQETSVAPSHGRRLHGDALEHVSAHYSLSMTTKQFSDSPCPYGSKYWYVHAPWRSGESRAQAAEPCDGSLLCSEVAGLS